MTSGKKDYAVRAVRCRHDAGRDEIRARLEDATAPLARAWEKIGRARTVGIKFNMQMPAEDVRRAYGRRQDLVDDDVIRAALSLLRARTDAKLFVLDSSLSPPGRRPGRDFTMGPLLEEFGVEYVEAGDPPLARYAVPGGGLMFREYLLHEALGRADAFVSIAKMKSHRFTGVTLCLKNLFGLPPIAPHGRARQYFHHVVRLPRVLCDLGLVASPCLNVIDALVGQSGAEWDGEARVADTLIAGDHVIATDACGAFLMGHDPALDWPNPPFRRERNAIAIAAENGFGTTDLSRIDFESEVESPIAAFDSIVTDPPERVASLRTSACVEALRYLERRAFYADRFAGKYVYLQDGDVVWSGDDPSSVHVGALSAGPKAGLAAWLKLVDPEEREGERFDVYADALRHVPV